MTPRTMQEFVFGTSKQVNPTLTARAGTADTGIRTTSGKTRTTTPMIYGMPNGWAKYELYIYNLADQCVGLGCSASSYVIADLDRAYTKYYEATRRPSTGSARSTRAVPTRSASTRGTSTRTTRRPGQPMTPTFSSGRRTSATAPGASCGTSRKAACTAIGPPPLKLYGYYSLPWDATVGGFFSAQSGQVWEATSVQPYVQYTSSTSATNRYTEQAGSRRTIRGIWSISNYVQNIPLGAATPVPGDRGRLQRDQLADRLQLRVQPAEHAVQHAGVVPQPASRADLGESSSSEVLRSVSRA